MKFKNTLLGFTFLALIFLFGCENCEMTDPMISSYITLKIVDAYGKNLVNPSTGPYYPDSVKASSKDNSSFSFEIQESTAQTEIHYIIMPSFNEMGKTELYLHLNHLDTDTLLITYKSVKQKCGAPYFVYTGFIFNGKNIAQTGILKLVK